MNVAVTMTPAAEGFLRRYEGLRQRLPGDRAVRDEAAARFRDGGGLPTVRDEPWRYTNLRPLAALHFDEALSSIDDAATRVDLPDAPRVVLIDGRLRPDLCILPDGVTLVAFADEPRFGRLADPASERLVALNTMLAEDGARLSVADGADAGVIHFISIATETPGRTTAIHPRHAVTLGRGARLTLFETARGEGAYLHNPVTEITVAENAHMVHARLQDEADTAFHLATIYAEIAADATYDAFTLNLGARLARAEFHARLIGPRASVHLNGAQVVGGERLSDFTSVVAHDAPNCASRQTVKTVLDDRARGVFQGRIEVARVAQKTDGYQMNQALLLSPEAEIDSKPELRINADDVKCSHGATVGELDATQLFYLRSRGVPAAEARAILVRAFLTEALDAVTDDTVRATLDEAVAGWWERKAA